MSSGFWLSPSTASPQRLWAACCSVCLPPSKKHSLMFGQNFLLFNLGPLPSVLPPITRYYQEEPGCIFLIFPIRYLFLFAFPALTPPLPSPQPLSSPDWTTTIFSDSPCLSNAARPYHLCGLLLDLLLCLPVSCPGELSTEHGAPDPCWHSLSYSSQGGCCLLCCRGTLLTRGHLGVQ